MVAGDTRKGAAIKKASSHIFKLAKCLSNDDVGAARGTVSQEIRLVEPVSKPEISSRENWGGNTVVRLRSPVIQKLFRTKSDASIVARLAESLASPRTC